MPTRALRSNKTGSGGNELTFRARGIANKNGLRIRAMYEALEAEVHPDELHDHMVEKPIKRKEFWKRDTYAHFCGALVKALGHTVSEFLWKLDHTTKGKQGRFKQAFEFQTAEVFGGSLGIGRKQFYNVAKAAAASKYTTCERVFRGTQCLRFEPTKKLSELIEEEQERTGRRYPFFYHTGLARHVSINAAILYNVIHRKTADEKGMDPEYAKCLDHFVARVAMTGKGCEAYFPWMTRQDVSRAMLELLDHGLTEREPNRSDPYSKWLYRVARQDSNRTLDQVVARLDAELVERAKRKEREADKLIAAMKTAQKTTSENWNLLSENWNLGCPETSTCCPEIGTSSRHIEKQHTENVSSTQKNPDSSVEPLARHLSVPPPGSSRSPVPLRGSSGAIVRADASDDNPATGSGQEGELDARLLPGEEHPGQRGLHRGRSGRPGSGSKLSPERSAATGVQAPDRPGRPILGLPEV